MRVHTILEIDEDGDVASIFTTFDEQIARDLFDNLCLENKCIAKRDSNALTEAENFVAGDESWSIHWFITDAPSGM